MTSGTDFNISFVTLPIEALGHPLCVIPDCGGDRDIYFAVLKAKCYLNKLPRFSILYFKEKTKKNLYIGVRS